jgi:predicted dehydrogenase
MYEDYSGGPATDLYPHSLTPVLYMLGLKFPNTVVATGGKFRYSEREVPDTFNLLIDYPEKITIAVLGTQGNDHFGTGERGSPGRCPVIRGWDGTLTFVGEEIVFTPTQGSKKEARRFPIEHGQDQLAYWRTLLEACRTRRQPASSAELALYVQTPLQMGVLGWREGKVARFDAGKKGIVL